MPRGDDAYQAAIKPKAITTAWLVALPAIPKANDPSTTAELYFTDWHESIVYDGDTYLPSPLDVNVPTISQDEEKATGQISLCNLTSAITGYVRDYRIQDAPVVAIHAVKSTGGWVGSYAFVGVADSHTTREDQVAITISRGRSVAMLLPRILYTSRDFPHLPSSKDPRRVDVR